MGDSSLATGFALPVPGVPTENPPGVGWAIWAVPGAVVALVASYRYGSRLEKQRPAGAAERDLGEAGS